MPGWTSPIVVGRHAFGDQYRCQDGVTTKPGKVELVYTPKDGSEPTRQLVHNFDEKNPEGCYMGMFNTESSIRSFAQSCMGFALQRNMPLKLSTKNTILKKYDGMFMEVFQEEYDLNFREKFEK